MDDLNLELVTEGGYPTLGGLVLLLDMQLICTHWINLRMGGGRAFWEWMMSLGLRIVCK